MSVGESMAASLRLFIALELPFEWREALVERQQVQEKLSPAYFRWVAPENMHLTVIFVGQIPADAVHTVSSSLASAAATGAPMRLALGTIGAFGPRRAPRVMFVRVTEPSGSLARLRTAAARELRAAGAGFDDRPLIPHVTLGRARRGARLSPRLLAGAVDLAPYTVREAVLFESCPGPAGLRYEPLTRATLGESASAPPMVGDESAADPRPGAADLTDRRGMA